MGRHVGVLAARGAPALLALALLPGPAAALDTAPKPCERISVSSGGTQTASASYGSSISGLGRYAVLQTDDGGIVPGDTNGAIDVFVRDLKGRVNERVSVSSAGAEGNGHSQAGCLSADGSRVAFQSLAGNLAAGDENGTWDVFVRDRTAGTTARVSVSSAGTGSAAPSYSPAISADGDTVAFTSLAGDLVPGDTGDHGDVFVHGLATGETERVSVNRQGQGGDGDSTRPSLSTDGRFVAFESNASNLASGTVPGTWQVYVRDRALGRTVVASADASGVAGAGDARSGAISGDGRYVAFVSSAAGLAEGDEGGAEAVFLKDLQTGAVLRVSEASDGTDADAASDAPSISADGAYVAYRSDATNLVTGDGNDAGDLFVFDVAAGRTKRVSAGAGGFEANGASRGGAISPDGRYAVFDSDASNLVADDSNGVSDVFRAEVAPRGFPRVAGASRFDTAIEASKLAFPHGADTVVVATGRNWPDALGGAALAGTVGGPVLLVEPTSLPEQVGRELARLAPSKIYVLGSELAVDDGVEDELKGLSGAPEVVRLGGAGRYATASLVASEVVSLHEGAWDGRVLVATGGDYPDALAASPVAFARGIPVVLARPASAAPTLPPAATSAVVLGSELAVSGDTFDTLEAQLGEGHVDRLEGQSRYGTAAAIAGWGAGLGLRWDGVALSTGENYPDALAGGAMAGRLGSVMLLTRTASLPGETADALGPVADEIASVRVLGKPAAVSDEVITQARTALGE